MAKKETLNPITAFRKANEARKAVVMKSLKKAQEGIVQDTSVHELSHAAQEPINKYKPWEGKVKLNSPFDPLRSEDLYKKSQKLASEAEETKNKLDRLNAIYPGYQTPYQKKKGGPVKRKK